MRDRRQKLGRVSKEKGRWRHRFSLQKKTMKWDRGQGRQEKARLTEDRETEDRRQRIGDRGQGAEGRRKGDRGQGTKGRGQGVGDSGQMTGNRGQRTPS